MLYARLHAAFFDPSIDPQVDGYYRGPTHRILGGMGTDRYREGSGVVGGLDCGGVAASVWLSVIAELPLN